MISSKKVVVVNFINLPDNIQNKFQELYNHRFHNDTAIYEEYGIPTYDELLHWDEWLAETCKECECTAKEYLADNVVSELIKMVYDLKPEAFEDYEGINFDISW